MGSEMCIRDRPIEAHVWQPPAVLFEKLGRGGMRGPGLGDKAEETREPLADFQVGGTSVEAGDEEVGDAGDVLGDECGRLGSVLEEGEKDVQHTNKDLGGDLLPALLLASARWAAGGASGRGKLLGHRAEDALEIGEAELGAGPEREG